MGAPGTTGGMWKATRCGEAAPNNWNVISDLPTPQGQAQRIQTIDQVLSYCGAEEAAANAHQIAASGALYDALEALFANYKQLADSGDAGNWSLEEQAVGKQALAALALARGEHPTPHPTEGAI